MAHELGLLLLAMNAHGRTGLMRARWSSDELRRPVTEQWTFTERNGRDLRRAATGGPRARGSSSR